MNDDPYLDAFRFTMHMMIKAIAQRHQAEFNRNWKTVSFLNRSEAQKRRQERERKEKND